MSFLGDIFKNIAGPLVGGAIGYKGAQQQGDDALQISRETNQFSANQTAEQMAFQERMSGTSYQRAVGDMQSAGLNPMLAYSQGGASTPSGGAAQGVQAPTFNKLAGAIQSASQVAQIENLEAQTGKTRAETDNIKAEQIEWDKETGGMKGAKTYSMRLQFILGEKRFQELKHEVAKTDLTEKEIQSVVQHIKNLKTKNRLDELDIPRAVNEAKAQESWYMKEIAPYTGEVGKAVGSAAQLRGISRPNFSPYKPQFPNRR